LPLAGSEAGIVQVAIWRDHPAALRMHDVFTAYSHDLFYDFAKPLRLLDSSGWSSQIRAGSADGFFVFTYDDLMIFDHE